MYIRACACRCSTPTLVAPPPPALPSSPVLVAAPHICLGPHLPDLCCRMSRDLPADIFGPHIPWREYSFMSNPRLAQAVLDSVVMLEVCQVGPLAQGVHPRLRQVCWTE